MTDVLFADISSYQPLADDTYPYRAITIRSNDGTYQDPHFRQNIAWAKHAVDTGKLDFFGVYFVFEPNWSQTVETLKAMVGKPHPRMFVLIDVESWGGRMVGDYSNDINAARKAVRLWLRENSSPWQRLLRRPSKRVGGYANAGDFANIWPRRPGARRMWVDVANYSFNPDFPGKLFHQFSSSFDVPPFGKCDINSADGLTVAQVMARLGVGKPDPQKPAPKPPRHRPKPKPRPRPDKPAVYVVQMGDSMWGIADKFHVPLLALIKANPQIKRPDRIKPGDKVTIPPRSSK